jgi:hypothetical protein
MFGILLRVTGIFDIDNFLVVGLQLRVTCRFGFIDSLFAEVVIPTSGRFGIALFASQF